MMLLAKIQDEKYIKDMYENEYLYFKGLKDFRSSKEDPSGRLDPKELNVKNVQLTYLSINTGTKEVELSKVLSNFSGQFMEHLDDPKINCCSLYTMYIQLDSSPNIDDKALDMGNKMLLIHDCKAFFEILDKSIESKGYEFKRGLVTYYDPKSHCGGLTLHHKDQGFSFQKEYRILIQPTNNDPVRVPLPGLKAISAVIDSKAVRTLRLTTKPNNKI